MKKFFLMATAGLMFAGVAMAHDGTKGKKKKCAKGKTCCSKDTKAKTAGCHDKAGKTAKM